MCVGVCVGVNVCERVFEKDRGVLGAEQRKRESLRNFKQVTMWHFTLQYHLWHLRARLLTCMLGKERERERERRRIRTKKVKVSTLYCEQILTSEDSTLNKNQLDLPNTIFVIESSIWGVFLKANQL